MNNGDVLNSIYSYDDVILPARSKQDFIEECDEDEVKHVYDNCKKAKEASHEEYKLEVEDTWDRVEFECPIMAAKISQLHRKTQIHNLVATLMHTLTCQERCDTPSCGHDAGACYDDNWCAPGCSPDKLLNLVCDQECFSAACGGMG